MKKKHLKYILLLVMIVAMGIAWRVQASGDSAWITDYQQALAESRKTGKVILADFSGSDWCGWCIKLDNEVFRKQAFKDWAKDNVILLNLDFPQSKSQPDALKAQNRRLAEKYGVRGFPTVLFLDQTGKVLGRSGYLAGGPAAWIESVKPILAKANGSAKAEVAARPAD